MVSTPTSLPGNEPESGFEAARSGVAFRFSTCKARFATSLAIRSMLIAQSTAAYAGEPPWASRQGIRAPTPCHRVGAKTVGRNLLWPRARRWLGRRSHLDRGRFRRIEVSAGRGRRFGGVPSCPGVVSSELDAQRKAKRPAIVERVGDRSERPRSKIDVRLFELRMVQSVQRLGPE